MEDKELVAAVGEHLGPYIDFFGLSHWVIDVKFDALNGRYGQCAHNIANFNATITIDLDEHRELAEEDVKITNDPTWGDLEDEDGKLLNTVLHTLRHELLHLTHTPMYEVARAAWPFYKHDERIKEMVEDIVDRSVERHVSFIERLLDQNGISVPEFSQMVAKEEEE